MFDNLQVGSMSDLSEEELDSAMGVAPAKKPSKKAPEQDDEPETGKKPKKSQTSKGKADPVFKKAPISTLSSKDANLAFGNQEDDDEPEEDEPEEEEIPKKKKPKKKDEDPEEDDETSEEDDEDPDENNNEEPEEEGEEEEEEEPSDEEAQINDFIKARVELLVKKGEWADWDGRDKEEWNEERFAEIELEQREHQRTKIRDEVLENFGPYGKEIAKYVENGGNPDELIDIFKEQQRAEAISLETPEQKKEAIFRYETEFLGKKSERVKKYIDGLGGSELDEEAKDAKENMERHWQEEADRVIAEQAQEAEGQKTKQLEDINKFSSKVKELVSGNKDIPDDEKKALLKVLTEFKKKLPNGMPVNDFYFKFADFRKSLPDYINLVRFVLDPKKFIKTIETKGKNAATEKSFSLARNSNRSKKSRSGSESGDSRLSSSKKSGFKLLY